MEANVTEEERNEGAPAPVPSPRSRRAAAQKMQIEAESAEERADGSNGDEPGGAGQSTGESGRTDADAPRRRSAGASRPAGRSADGAKPGQKETPKDAKDRKKRSMRRMFTAFFFVGVVASGLWLFFGGEHFSAVKTSEGISLLKGKQVERVQITEGTQQVRLWLSQPTKATDEKGKSHDVGKRVQFSYVEPQAEQIARLTEQAKPKLGYDSIVPQASIWSSILTMAVPMLIIIVAFMILLPRMQSGMGAFGRIKDRKQLDPDKPDVTFNDVAGEDEAVAELREITEFLTAPERFHALGAEIPRGVLLYGPPGTGKTLLARAVAGEAGVPFYSISASEFVEMFVGVGASRVRDLFNKAKENAPAIVFVDEIDAVGRGRGVGIGGGNDEREQTLNQLLVELDGFDSHSNVILIAATNRPDVLDPALLRPGRFDRQISVDAPDLRGREAILKVHAKGKPFAPDVDLAMVARRTPGYTGADLENILNEAALLAARFGRRAIGVPDVDEAIDRVMAGPQRRSRPMNDQDKLLTAYHEAGHALTAAALHNADPVTKVTILPRGRALGYTMVLPTEDRYSVSRNDLLDQLTYAMGGRVAEEIVFHDPTTGASNDIQKATSIARSMVTEYGMSAEVGIIRLAAEDADPLERTMGGGGEVHSDGMVSAIDVEARGLVENAHREAWAILAQNRGILDILASRLMEKETVLESELKEIFADVVKAPVRERWHVFEVPAELLAATEIPPIEIRSPQPVKGRHAAAPVDSDASAAPSPAAPNPAVPSPAAPNPAVPNSAAPSSAVPSSAATGPAAPVSSVIPPAAANAGGSAFADPGNADSSAAGAPEEPPAIPDGGDELEESAAKPSAAGEPGTVLSPSVPAAPSAQSPDPLGDVTIPELSADAAPRAPMGGSTPNLPGDPKLPDPLADSAPSGLLGDPASSDPANEADSSDSRDGLPATDRLPKVDSLPATDRLPKLDPLSATERLPKLDPSGPSPLSSSASLDPLSTPGGPLSASSPLDPLSRPSRASASSPPSASSPDDPAGDADSDGGADPSGKPEPSDG